MISKICICWNFYCYNNKQSSQLAIDPIWGRDGMGHFMIWGHDLIALKYILTKLSFFQFQRITVISDWYLIKARCLPVWYIAQERWSSMPQQGNQHWLNICTGTTACRWRFTCWLYSLKWWKDFSFKPLKNIICGLYNALKMLGLYLYTLTFSHKSCNM